jgi:hypothetical protein
MKSHETHSGKVKKSGQLQGLNQLRFLAAGLVFTQHAISSSHADAWIDVAGFRIGRIGTAMFFLLSGFLAAATTRDPLTWLKSRIAVLFPPYWIVTIAGFILAGVTATKSFDVWQVVSQMAGTGYFTHGDHIVNVATWFVSPLLALYGVVTLIRLTSPRLALPLVIAATVASSLTIASDFAALHCHCVTFFMAFAVASIPDRNRTTAAACMAVSLLTLCLFQPEFRYGTLASCLLVPALHVRKEIRACNWFSSIAYEWFLVHGLCLAIVSHLTQLPTVIFVVGAILSVIGAMVLKNLVQIAGKLFSGRQDQVSQATGLNDGIPRRRFSVETQRRTLPKTKCGAASDTNQPVLVGSSEVNV